MHGTEQPPETVGIMSGITHTGIVRTIPGGTTGSAMRILRAL